MKKFAVMALTLAMVLSLAACGDSGSKDSGTSSNTAENSTSDASVSDTSAGEDNSTASSEESTETSVQASEEVSAENTDQPPDDAVQVSMMNKPLNIKVDFFAPAYEGYKLEPNTSYEKYQDNVQSRMTWNYKTEDNHGFTVDAYLNVLTNKNKALFDEGTAQYEGYTKTDLGNGLETYIKYKIDEGENQYMDWQGYMFLGDYLDGTYVLSVRANESLKDGRLTEKGLDELLTGWLKYAKITGDDSYCKTEGGDLKYFTYDITIPETIKIGDNDVKVSHTIKNMNPEFTTEPFAKDGLTYTIYTWDVMSNSTWKRYTTEEKYVEKFKPAKFAGYDSVMSVGLANGKLQAEAYVKLEDDKILRIYSDANDFLSGDTAIEGLSILEKSKEMINDEHIESTREMFSGFMESFVGAMKIGQAGDTSADGSAAAAE